MADIYICKNNSRRAYKLPIIPECFPQLSQSASNEEFETFSDGTYNILGEPKLKEFSLEGTLPTRHYEFAKSNVLANEIIELLKNSLNSKKPLRVIMSGRTYTNILCSVESLSFGENHMGNIDYSVSFKEYRNV
ncbi:MAG: hypothetical protein RSD67_08405 [Oscillospiraceae bacterium]